MFVLVLLFTVLNGIIALPSGMPCGWNVRAVASNLGSSTDVCPLDATRTIVTRKSGVIQLVKNNQVIRALDLSSVVESSGELGVMSCAVDASTNLVYISYTFRNTTNGQKCVLRVSRWKFDAATESLVGEQVILGACRTNSDCLPIHKLFHAGGAMAFSPDGVLFVSTGDAQLYEGGSVIDTSYLAPQEHNDYRGKILRINKDTGEGLLDNPWFSPEQPIASRVFGTGFRNPWAMTFGPEYDANNPEIFVYHVGFYKWESLVRIKRGGNGGWPCFEATRITPQKTNAFCQQQNNRSLALNQIPPPLSSSWTRFDNRTILWEYAHNGQSACIIGAAVIPLAFPEPFGGSFIGADYSRGWLFSTRGRKRFHHRCDGSTERCSNQKCWKQSMVVAE
jgi:glucose/arabinose dehydrogenase